MPHSEENVDKTSSPSIDTITFGKCNGVDSVNDPGDCRLEKLTTTTLGPEMLEILGACYEALPTKKFRVSG